MNDHTDEVVRLSFEGPLTATGAGIIMAVAVLLFGGLLWRDRQVTGTTTALLFFALRSVVTGVAVWMLLGANSVRETRNESSRTVVLAADVSPSMSTIDDDHSMNVLRWGLAADPASADSPAVRCDCALVSTAFANQQLARLVAAVERHRPADDARRLLENCRDTLLRAEQHCQAASAQTSDRPRRQTLEDVLDRLAEAQRKVAAELKEWNGAPDFEQLDRLTSTINLVAGAEHVLRRLSTGMLNDLPTQSQQGETSGKSRLARVANVADLAQRNVAGTKQPPTVKRILFDDRATQLPDDTGLAEEARTALASHTSTLSDDKKVSTDLGIVFETLRSDNEDRVAAIVMLTDAAHNSSDRPSPWEMAAALPDVPVHVVPIGSTRQLRDLVLYSVVAPPVVMEKDKIVIEAHLRALGCDGESSLIELLRDGEVIDFAHVDFEGAAASRQATFQTEAGEQGTYRYELRASGIDTEQSVANNAQQISVRVTRRDIRVLLADGLARWEFTYLRNLFRRDETVECDELVFAPRILGTGSLESDPRLPETPDGWDQYDVAILGDISKENFSSAAQAALDEFVAKRGGTAILIAGDRHFPADYVNTPLLDLLPTQRQTLGPEPEDGFRLLLTAAGRRHQSLTIGDDQMDSTQTWEYVSQNVPIYALSEYSRPKPAAETLIEAVSTVGETTGSAAESMAFLCWQPVGRGRVVYLSSPDTWRLRFRRGDALHHRFWGQILRWAIAPDLRSGSKLVQLRTNRSHYEAQEPVEVEVLLADRGGNPVLNAVVSAIANRPGGLPESLKLLPDPTVPGRYSSSFTTLEAGDYSIVPGGETVDALTTDSGAAAANANVTIRPRHHPELLDTRCRLDVAQKIATATGGQIIPPTALAEILTLVDLTPIVSESSISAPLWPEWRYFWIVFLGLNLEWAIRKWKGLP